MNSTSQEVYNKCQGRTLDENARTCTQGLSHCLVMFTAANFILGANNRSKLIGTIVPSTAMTRFIHVEGLVRDNMIAETVT